MREPSPRSDNRKQEFLSAALELFYEKGYDGTTIHDIIEKMGVSKGAFYHYFKSKEEVIIEIARDYVHRILSLMKRIASRDDINSVDKLNEMFYEVNLSKRREEQRRYKMKGIFDDEKNLKLERKISNAVFQDAVAVFQEIFEQGIREGSFPEGNARETAEFLFSNISHLNAAIDRLVQKHGTGEVFAKQLDEKLRFYERAINAVIGLEEGTIRVRESYWRRYFQ